MDDYFQQLPSEAPDPQVYRKKPRSLVAVVGLAVALMVAGAGAAMFLLVVEEPNGQPVSVPAVSAPENFEVTTGASSEEDSEAHAERPGVLPSTAPSSASTEEDSGAQVEAQSAKQ